MMWPPLPSWPAQPFHWVIDSKSAGRSRMIISLTAMSSPTFLAVVATTIRTSPCSSSVRVWIHSSCGITKWNGKTRPQSSVMKACSWVHSHFTNASAIAMVLTAISIGHISSGLARSSGTSHARSGNSIPHIECFRMCAP